MDDNDTLLFGQLTQVHHSTNARMQARGIVRTVGWLASWTLNCTPFTCVPHSISFSSRFLLLLSCGNGRRCSAVTQDIATLKPGEVDLECVDEILGLECERKRSTSHPTIQPSTPAVHNRMSLHLSIARLHLATVVA